MNPVIPGDLAYVRVPFDGIYEGHVVEVSDRVTLQLKDGGRVKADPNQVWRTFDQFARLA